MSKLKLQNRKTKKNTQMATLTDVDLAGILYFT